MTIAPGTSSLSEPSIRARRVAALASDGVDDASLAAVSRSLSARGATVRLVAPRPGSVRTSSGTELHVDHSLISTRAHQFDAVVVPGGERSVRELRWDPRAWVFLTEACETGRAILALGVGALLFDRGADDRLSVCANEHVVFANGDTCPFEFLRALARASGARARRTPAYAVPAAQA